MREANRNIRFWDWVNDGWVKITLTPEKPRLTHDQSRTTDEGWEQSSAVWTADWQKQLVTVFNGSDGVDCDGRLSSWSEVYSRFDALHEVPAMGWDRDGTEYPLGFNRPDWGHSNFELRDYSAEQMGY